MIDWGEVAMATVRAEGRGWTEVADLLIQQRVGPDEFIGVLGERVEGVFGRMEDEWRAAGVDQPMTVLALLATANMAMLAVGFWAMPRRMPKLVAGACVVGLAYGTYQVVTRD